MVGELGLRKPVLQTEMPLPPAQCRVAPRCKRPVGERTSIAHRAHSIRAKKRKSKLVYVEMDDCQLFVEPLLFGLVRLDCVVLGLCFLCLLFLCQHNVSQFIRREQVGHGDRCYTPTVCFISEEFTGVCSSSAFCSNATTAFFCVEGAPPIFVANGYPGQHVNTSKRNGRLKRDVYKQSAQPKCHKCCDDSC